MLLDLDAKKAAALLCPLIEAPSADGTIRERLEAFAAAEGLQL
jgi:phosphotransferase system enzyme I (PtsP)